MYPTISLLAFAKKKNSIIEEIHKERLIQKAVFMLP